MTLEICTRCRWAYPDELLSQMFINGGYTNPICGICAEELTGIRLHGEQASQMRNEAKVWRIKHPEKKLK